MLIFLLYRTLSLVSEQLWSSVSKIYTVFLCDFLCVIYQRYFLGSLENTDAISLCVCMVLPCFQAILYVLGDIRTNRGVPGGCHRLRCGSVRCGKAHWNENGKRLHSLLVLCIHSMSVWCRWALLSEMCKADRLSMLKVSRRREYEW